jgi:hypothetical protein
VCVSGDSTGAAGCLYTVLSRLIETIRRRKEVPLSVTSLAASGRSYPPVTGQLLSYLQSYLITRDQANSAGDNKKVYNKSCDKARACVELG